MYSDHLSELFIALQDEIARRNGDVLHLACVAGYDIWLAESFAQDKTVISSMSYGFCTVKRDG